MRYRELYEYHVEIDGGNSLNLSKNPGPTMLAFFIGTCRRGIARGCIVGPDIYLWDACLATHEDIQTHFGVPVENDGFDVAEIHEGEDYQVAAQEAAWPMLQRNPFFARLLADPRFHAVHE